ncbi:mannose-1-phosphate guanylyltransferase/mannose-6-phosphate isomerase [Dokdonella fugitiva]|uniref:mannose-1-phosphate guanylyltransferase/mannose-6-phosphate isomerase n=1 Tax=Dokdonella fugitiva TaxID=328517 RepID=UPI0015FE7367|nr:mannose-1-phosphate guanylyltransferase/mannose-6-phosphate isomerase [Dokdonella fugitiva]MBA8884179.1 mannose-1-phosphate guanylyltransferase/mannose-6-phosphate isomerase [Dokdonella fugitiva]
MLVPVILSGGAGTRLWPVSRSAYPKPFMRMGDGESLLKKTLDRALRCADDGTVLTVTGRDYYFLTRDEYAQHEGANLDTLPFLLEPAGRNTAPAVVLAALHARDRVGADATLLILPADHLIRDLDAFVADARRAAALAADGWLVTFGIRPTHPETGFGYIRMGEAIAGRDGRGVAAFVEKPNLQTAESYVASGDYVWNSGMFCFRADALLAVASEVCPDVLKAAEACHAHAMNHESPIEFGREAFLAQPDISIDYAIMERAPKVAVVPASFDWSDIGSWKAMSDLEAEADDQGNRVRGQAIVVESTNCYIQSDARMVAAVGVQDLVIVDTGDAVLVSHRERAQQVKLVVERLRATNHAAANVHQTVHRPWGSYTVLEDADDCKVKRLTVKPGHVLSLQLHHRRSEHWTVVEGTAKVRVGEEEFLLQRNQSTYIPMNTVHRLENPTDRDIHLIEVQCGDYFGEDDIVRLEDRYGRAQAAAK